MVYFDERSFEAIVKAEDGTVLGVTMEGRRIAKALYDEEPTWFFTTPASPVRTRPTYQSLLLPRRGVKFVSFQTVPKLACEDRRRLERALLAEAI